ncbi:T9SS type A sorting domain-containing protein [Lacinutrix jangbogonensis]|uniref:T9SS type A sorting domain-containing protein n=1 Tax=Lacinutrix jangbogonensis TaxID=1469557 RepID=UPI00053ED560|nr:T9SS type A sorting domain-containing protein [Lacinutrix jangbogonensis]
MKTRLLYLLLLVCSFSFSQILPSGHYGKFEFTNGSLVNIAANGGPDLAGTVTFGIDRNGNVNDAIASTSVLAGHTLGTSDYKEVTLSFWVKNNLSTNSNGQRIIQVYGAGGYGFRFEMDGQKLYLRSKIESVVSGTLNDWNSDDYVTIADNQWHNITLRTTLTYSGARLELDVFVDGTIQNNISGFIDPFNTGIATFLESAQMVINPTGGYTGSIDDVYFYKSALSDTQIADLSAYYPTTSALTKFYIDASVSATGNNDGSSWSNAYKNLQSALTNATDGDEIWIASGTYKPEISNRSARFDIIAPNLSIYGGFTGTETQLSERVLGSNETILSGDLLGNDVFVDDHYINSNNHSSKTDNSHHILNITDLGENLVLDGLTVSNAHNSTSTRGAAIIKEKSIVKLTLNNCTILNNIAKNGASGLFAEFELNNGFPSLNSNTGARGELIVENCKIINNMSLYGSGIYSYAKADTNVDIRIENSLFDNNVAGDLSNSTKGLSGSAAWFRSIGTSTDVNIKLINNTFVNNIDDSTGNSLNDNSRATVAINKTAGTIIAEVVNCIFWDNYRPTQTTNTPVRSITNTYNAAAQSISVLNSIDPLNFNDASITSATATNTANPLFTSLTDYTLQANSPAKDAGNNSYVNTTLDLLGNQRVFNTTVDMGAYEFSTTLSVNEVSVLLENFAVYPNPVTTILNIKLEGTIEKVEVYSILGAKVLERTKNNINVANLSSGVYVLKVYTEDGSIRVKRFIKE